MFLCRLFGDGRGKFVIQIRIEASAGRAFEAHRPAHGTGIGTGGIGGIGALPATSASCACRERLTVGNCSGSPGSPRNCAPIERATLPGSKFGKRIDRRIWDGRADRLRQAERGGVNGAEGRSDQVSARAGCHAGLARQQRAQILEGDRRGQQREGQREHTDTCNARVAAAYARPAPNALTRHHNFAGMNCQPKCRECDRFCYFPINLAKV